MGVAASDLRDVAEALALLVVLAAVRVGVNTRARATWDHDLVVLAVEGTVVVCGRVVSSCQLRSHTEQAWVVFETCVLASAVDPGIPGCGCCVVACPRLKQALSNLLPKLAHTRARAHVECSCEE